MESKRRKCQSKRWSESTKPSFFTKNGSICGLLKRNLSKDREVLKNMSFTKTNYPKKNWKKNKLFGRPRMTGESTDFWHKTSLTKILLIYSRWREQGIGNFAQDESWSEQKEWFWEHGGKSMKMLLSRRTKGPFWNNLAFCLKIWSMEIWGKKLAKFWVSAMEIQESLKVPANWSD